MKKVFLFDSTFDPDSWKFYESNTHTWIRVKNIEEADILLFVDNYMVTADTSKKRILFLSEPIGIRPIAFELLKKSNYLNYFDLIGTCHSNYCDELKIIKTPSNVPNSVNFYYNFNKNKLCSMLFSGAKFAPGHILRKNLSLKQFIFDVDRYGNMFNNFINDKSFTLNDYCYSFSIENCSEPGYFTEKINDCFATCTIPIYWGDPEISKIYNTDGIIFLENLDENKITKKFYDTKIKAIEENYNIVSEVIKTNNMHYPINYLMEKI